MYISMFIPDGRGLETAAAARSALLEALGPAVVVVVVAGQGVAAAGVGQAAALGARQRDVVVVLGHAAVRVVKSLAFECTVFFFPRSTQ